MEFMSFQYRFQEPALFSNRKEQDISLDLRLLPISIAALSISFQIFYLALNRFNPALKQGAIPSMLNSRVDVSFWHDFARYHGSPFRIGCMVAQSLGSIALLVLSWMTTAQNCKEPSDWLNSTIALSCPERLMTLTFVYTSNLSLISLFSRRWGQLASRYSSIVLFSALAVYTYRDIWPLATYSQHPKDLSEGKVLWLKLGTLAFTALIIPIFTPRRYVPVDAKNPMLVPNPEQTASFFSSVTYSYVDSVVLSASKVSHLPHDQFPPLSDNDTAQYQSKEAFPYIDPLQRRSSKQRHIFFPLMWHFRREYIIMISNIVLISVFSFAGPIGLKEILRYLETSGENASIRPWFWIVLLFFGALCLSIGEERMLFYSTLIRVRAEALLTQLVFQHSLRARIKGETSTKKSGVNVASNGGSSTDSGTTETEDREDKKSEAFKNQIGMINNLVTSDLNNIITGGTDLPSFAIQVPIKAVGSIIFLYHVLGWSAVVTLVVMIVFFPVPRYIAKSLQQMQKNKMEKTDARVQIISEAINVLRMIKLFGWENKMSKKVYERRNEELYYQWKFMLFQLINNHINSFIPTITMLLTYITYTVIMKEELTASKIFSSMAVFSILRGQLYRLSWSLPSIIRGKVSVDRLNEFMQHTKLLDSFIGTSFETVPDLAQELVPDSQLLDPGHGLGFKDATFSWSVEDENTSSAREFRLSIDGELRFKPRSLNLIIGPTGSGKTSLLMALLGEMHFVPSNTSSWFNLPRNRGVAYAAQESWVQNTTIRENIVFGSPFDAERYNKVIGQCALEHDLELFDAGDMTEVGEKGLTLSGGQKARVTLARAIYSFAEIILLDDVLAALDVHTAAWIVEQCFRGDLVKGRTILLVTHNVALVAPVAEFVVSIGLDGRIQSQGTEISVALSRDPILASEVEHHQQLFESEEKGAEEPQSQKPAVNGKLVVPEEIVHGHVTWKSMGLIFSGLGGNHPVLFFTTWILVIIMETLVSTVQIWFLGFWGSQYEMNSPSEVRIYFYLGVFLAIALTSQFVSIMNSVFYNLGILRASKTIHTLLIDSVFGATLRWLDETPTARIIARCTQDIGAIDGPIPQSLNNVVNLAIGTLISLGAVVLFTPIFLLPGVAVGVLGMLLGNLYLKAQLSVKREMSNSRSPVLAHFSAAIHGLVSIRAFGAQKAFVDESFKRIDFYSRTARISWNLNRWIGIRIDTLGAFFTAALATYLVYGTNVSAANTGFSITMALDLCSSLFLLIRIFNRLEVESNSLERIQGYIDIEHEARPTPSGFPPAAWPKSGDLRVENLSARYSEFGPEVLHNVSFHIPSGQRIGVVGRTGSGKSSLTLALLKCILTEGDVYYDGIPTNTINLDALRSSITIIPQTARTLRQNLDPFEQNDDATLNDALKAAGLFSLQFDNGQGSRFSLDTKIAGGGSNLSVGERQILALARAMIRESKLLILDEATSAIDYKTEAIIQSTLRTQLGPDVTVITVAHRLQTIMDVDKIMVMDNGSIVEFDTPKNLMKNDHSFLKALVDGSNERAALYALADTEA